jgi:protein O-GlcNAc transferase
LAYHAALTFGCCSSLAAMGERTLSAWSEILCTLPDARLLLVADGLRASSARERLWQRFQRDGIAPERVLLRATAQSAQDQWSVYQELDIVLDTFPRNGTRANCDALYMGVPVISLLGKSSESSRDAQEFAQVLKCVGLEDLTAATASQYVATAAALAADTSRRRRLRTELRERMSASTLMDVPAFVARLEAVYLALL